MQEDFNKYWFECFDIKKISDHKSRDLAFNEEDKAIKNEDKELLYNNYISAFWPSKWSMSEETKRIISNRMMWNKFWKLAQFTDERKKAIWLRAVWNKYWVWKFWSKERKEEYSIMRKSLNKKHSEETKLKMSLKTFKRPVIQLNKLFEVVWEYRSISDASKNTGIVWSSINYCTLWKYKTAWGYIRKYK